MRIGDREVGPEHPTYIVAEIGINHNGSIQTALELMDAAHKAGADAVKFQKRTPEIVTRPEIQDNMRYDTPWGDVKYLDYRRKVEFGERKYTIIDEFADELGIHWFASAWDVPSVEFLEQFDPVAHKVASAMNTNRELVYSMIQTGRPIIMSTGMQDASRFFESLAWFPDGRLSDEPYPLALLQCVGVYPAELEQLNLRFIRELRAYADAVGYSNHSPGITACVAAAALGADIIEAHITLDRTNWGSDQAASIEPHGFERMVDKVRAVRVALGSPEKKFLDAERAAAEKLRWHEDE